MAKHTISEAARLTGKARSTLHRHIKSGRLSKGEDDDGMPVIDTSELQRVYGPLQLQHSSGTVAITQYETPQTDSQNSSLQAEVEALRQEKVERLEFALEEARQAVEDARNERDDWKAQAQRLLSDQRPVAGGGSIKDIWKRMVGS